MSMQVVNRNNVVAGVFLIAGGVLAVAISFVLSDVGDRFGSTKQYVVRFPTSVGVSGLKPGATVTFGGLNVGKVESITAHTRHDPESGLDLIVAHDVAIEIASDLALHEDAFADLSLPMLGGVSTINIPSAGGGTYEGGPQDANVVLDEGETLRGRFAPSILTQLGFSTEDAEKIQQTIDEIKQVSANANEVSESFKRMSLSFEPEFGKGIDDSRSTLANIRDLTEKFSGEDGWSERVDRVLSRVDDASDQLSPTIESAQATIADAREIVSDGKPKVAQILDNVETTTERVKVKSVAQLDELLEKGSIALGSYKEFADKASLVLSENRTKVSATLDSARSIGVQGELFVEEIRAQPWRLLKKPSQKDLEREPIYEAARAYASAVSDLRLASEALDAAVGRAGEAGSSVNVGELAQIAKVVEQAYGRYEEAERGLLEKLRTPNPSTTP